METMIGLQNAVFANLSLKRRVVLKPHVLVVWIKPPKSVKDCGSRLCAKLKDAIMQTGQEKNLGGNHPISLPTADSHGSPPAFASDPLVTASSGPSVAKNGGEEFLSSFGEGLNNTSIVEIDGSNSAGNVMRATWRSNSEGLYTCGEAKL